MSGFDLQGIGDQGPRLLGAGTAPAPRQPRLLGETGEAAGVARGERPGAPAFGGLLADALERTAGLQDEVRRQSEAMVMGEPVALHDVMLSMGKSEVAFNLMLEVRNKLVDAWDKLSRSVV